LLASTRQHPIVKLGAITVIEDLPTSASADVAYGRAELTGCAQASR